MRLRSPETMCLLLGGSVGWCFLTFIHSIENIPIDQVQGILSRGF